LEGGVLKERCNRLFYISENKMSIAVEMKHLGCGEGDEA